MYVYILGSIYSSSFPIFNFSYVTYPPPVLYFIYRSIFQSDLSLTIILLYNPAFYLSAIENILLTLRAI